MQQKSGLNTAQIIVLNQIAADLTAQLARYDANAAALRQQYHVTVQKSRASGQPIPKPPAALSSLAAGRASLILQARDRLRTTLGDTDFTRLATYIRSNPPWKEPAPDALLMKPPIAPLPPDPVATERNAYKALFQLVRYLKTRAEQERKLELSNLAEGLQTLVQRQAGLTPEQGKVLDRVTSEYFVSLDGYKAQGEAAQLAYKRVCLDLLARDGKITAATSARRAFVNSAVQWHSFFPDTGYTHNYGAGSPANGSTLSAADEDGRSNDCYLWNNTGRASSAGFIHDETYPFVHQGQVHFAGSASNPLESINAPINWDMRILIDTSNPQSPTAKVNYNHTCYPSHQVKVNGQQVYFYPAPRHDLAYITGCLFLQTGKIIGEQTQPVPVPAR